ncbi:MAG: indole-3-glycerol phosphate synthase TrpC [Thermodesulfobacteriota bacterium]|nr:indole-3-glycerol phosphate synthase TrpC [Thermodesulfobacteriota bacterium]
MILDEIVLRKKKEVEEDKKRCPLDQLISQIKNSPQIRDIKSALTSSSHPIRIIAEVKKTSPSQGIIREDFDPVEIAKTYEDNKAAAISVLTEGNFFHGSLNFLKRIREVTSIPLLCKDFIFDTYQIYQARLFGADAFLLIAAILEDHLLDKLLKIGKVLGMKAIVEVHNREELKRVFQTNAEIIGINNRDLRTFKTDISTTIHLAKEIPDTKIVVSESGIHTCDHISRLKENGINKFLIGESLMREKNIGKKLTELLSVM